MRILCVCRCGNKRSVFTRYVLQGSGKHEALACGLKYNTPETIEMLCKWADKILLAELIMSESIPIQYQEKIDFDFMIGPDDFPESITGPLKDLIYGKLKLLGYI